MKSCRVLKSVDQQAEPLKPNNSRKRHRSNEATITTVESILDGAPENCAPQPKKPTRSRGFSEADEELQSILTPAKESIAEPCDDYLNLTKEKDMKHVVQYTFRNMMIGDLKPQPTSEPLPDLNWADSRELWKGMVSKEMKYQCDNKYMIRHPDLQPKMRAILLDWLIEVCEVYALHRETFYLATDYIDRFLSRVEQIRKNQLQLVGITALFIAAKLEEIYPPKLADFAYVTDGACTEDDILKLELLMLNKLSWALSPVTVNSWLNVYLQTAHLNFMSNPESTFVFPQYPQRTFVHIAQLTDLCVLDMESLEFSSGVIAASALYHFSSCELATHVSGYEYKDLAKCIHWMAPFAVTVRDIGLQPVKEFNKVDDSDAHNIQTHANDVSALERVYERRQRHLTTCSSPTEIAGIITPPKSNQKPPVVESYHQNRAGVNNC